MRVEIKKMGINGEGIGFFQKMPIFIPGVLLDEVVDVNIVSKQGRYMIGEVINIIKKSPYRIEPKNKEEYRSGGFPYLIVDYARQVGYKYDYLRESLIKYAQVDPRKILTFHQAKDCYYYRNQCKLPVSEYDGELSTGLYVANSNYFHPVDNSCIHEKSLEKVRQEVLNWCRKHQIPAYHKKTKEGLRNIIIRGFDQKFQCTLVRGESAFSQELIDDLLKIPNLVSVYDSINTQKNSVDIFGKRCVLLGGESFLAFDFMNLQLEISPRSFFQLNTKQAQNLYDYVVSLIKGPRKCVVEAYSGIGVMSLLLSSKAEVVYAIDNIKEAITNGKRIAKKNNISNVVYHYGNASEELEYISKKRKINTLLVDPPRSGLDDEMINVIIKSKIDEIVYVSCNPSTLAKNIAVLQNYYKVVTIKPFDMFPNTPHVETIVLMSREVE